MKTEFYNDDFLRKLIQEVDDCCPSDDFVEKVMVKCYANEIVTQPILKSRFKLSLPWITSGLVFVTLFTLVLIFGGGFLGGTIYGLFTDSILLKGLAAINLTYLSIGLGIISGIILYNKSRHNLQISYVL